MASGTNKTPAGLELAYDLEKGNIANALEAFVLSLHWSIIRTGLMQRQEGNQLTERLPPGWTQRGEDGATRTLTLYYFDRSNDKIKYELKVIELTPNDMVAVTFFRSSNNPGEGSIVKLAEGSISTTTGTGAASANRPASTASSGKEKNSAAATFQIGNFIKLDAFGEGGDRNTASVVYERADQLETQLYENIMEPLGLRVMGQPPVQGPYDDQNQKSKASSSSTQSEGSRRGPLHDDRNDRFIHPVIPDFGRRPSPAGPDFPLGPLVVPGGGLGGYGRSDLDPLGRFGAGGGNVLDPRGFRPPQPGQGGGGFGGMPGMGMPGNTPMPGAVPPGARFDPFGPPNPTRPGGGPGNYNVPNPDHERPPGPDTDYDDMFM